MPSVELESRPGFWLALAAGFLVVFMLAGFCDRLDLLPPAGALALACLRMWAIARRDRAMDLWQFRTDLDRTET